MTKVIAEDRGPAARRVPVEGVAIGVYGASGPPRWGRRRRARSSSPARRRKAFYIGNLAMGVAGRISPLKPV